MVPQFKRKPRIFADLRAITLPGKHQYSGLPATRCRAAFEERVTVGGMASHYLRAYRQLMQATELEHKAHRLRSRRIGAVKVAPPPTTMSILPPSKPHG